MTDNPNGWDFTDDPMNPTPLIFPECSECGEAYTYKRFLSLTRGDYVWAWAAPIKVPRGCRHRGPAKTVDNTK